MSEVISLGDHMARVCSCGSVAFNLLRSKSIECAGCGERFGSWSETDRLSHEMIKGLWAEARSSDEPGGPITRFARLIWRI